jgi:hypothetical protein
LSKIPYIVGSALLLALVLTGCSDPKGPESPLALSVNDSRFTVQEFYTLLKQETANDPEFDLNKDKKAAFMDYLVRKELLIQEASRLKLDREPDFVRTIERYWESTLIRNLLATRTEELRKNVLVTSDDVAAWYEKNRDTLDRPLDEMRPEIQKRIEEERVSALIESWIKNLVTSASVYRNPEALK